MSFNNAKFIIDSIKDLRNAILSGKITSITNGDGKLYRFHLDVRITDRFMNKMLTMGVTPTW